MKQKVIVGITAGIAAYKSLELIEKLKKEHIEVEVIMTQKATEMLASEDFEKVSENKINTHLFPKNFDYKDILTTRKVEHISLADSANVLVIAPATANCIAKLAYGIADDYLTTTALAVTCPIVLCPSMNVNMWQNPITSDNIEKLKARGFIIIDPTAGALACGYEGRGRLADVDTIKNEILAQLKNVILLKGKKILVTAGPTIERIDDVRFITNKSSGKMGVAIAQQCFLQGADVLLLKAENSVSPRYRIPQETFSTTDELSNLLKTHAPSYDIIFHTAAVSDFQVVNQQKGKIPSTDSFSLKLEPREKLIDVIRKVSPKIKLISFKAEYTDNETELIKTAKQRLEENKSDIVIINDVSKSDRGFGSDQNEVYIVSSNDVKKIILAPKEIVAKEILLYLQKLM